MRKEIQQHKETYDPSNVRDFIDDYLGKIEEHKLHPTSASSMFNGKYGVYSQYSSHQWCKLLHV